MNYIKEKLSKKPSKTEDDSPTNSEENSSKSPLLPPRVNSPASGSSEKRPEESSYNFLKRATSAQVFTYLKDNKLPHENREKSPTREKRVENMRRATSAEVYARLNKGFRPKNVNES